MDHQYLQKNPQILAACRSYVTCTSALILAASCFSVSSSITSSLRYNWFIPSPNSPGTRLGEHVSLTLTWLCGLVDVADSTNINKSKIWQVLTHILRFVSSCRWGYVHRLSAKPLASFLRDVADWPPPPWTQLTHRMYGEKGVPDRTLGALDGGVSHQFSSWRASQESHPFLQLRWCWWRCDGNFSGSIQKQLCSNRPQNHIPSCSSFHLANPAPTSSTDQRSTNICPARWCLSVPGVCGKCQTKQQ